MTEKDILNKLKSGEINSEQALEFLSEEGMSPSLLNDDNGHWAVSFDGFQNVPEGDKPEDITITYYVEAEYWKDNIHNALIWALEN